MPNLNLIEEEGGGEGTMQPVASPARKSGGGGGSKVVVIFLIILLLGGGVFALNKFGIVKLWGKKKPAVAQVQEEPFPQAEEFVDTTSVAAEDTAGIAFVETPPIEEVAKQPAPIETSMMSGKLAEMKGNYTIQVSAWRDPETAQTYVRRLEDAGYPAYVQKRATKDGDWYTVRIGRYVSIKEARKAVDMFAVQLKSNYWIDKVRM